MREVLRELRASYGAQLDDEIEGWIARLGDGAFPGMLCYQMGYVDHRFRPTAGHAGKRSRPLICLAVCEAVGGSWGDALSVAAGIELLHNFSLIHDDIEDHDPSRHHRPTVWKVWGEPQAINAGDAMLALAAWAVTGAPLSPSISLEMVSGFQEMSIALTRGQYLDMSFEGRQDVAPGEYLEMIGLKTAAILGYSAWAGATVGGADDASRRALRAFGEALGKAFQIEDDVQGIWGDPDKTGKVAASDLKNRKKTLPVLLGLERASGADRETLQAFYVGRMDDVSKVIAILAAVGAREACTEDVTRFRDDAEKALSGADLSRDSRDTLLALLAELTHGD